MGRAKLRIRKLETAVARQITFHKRKLGLAKKANELSILCDVDVALLMFSPSGKPTLCARPNGDLAGVLERFASVPRSDRLRRKMEIIDTLKRIFGKLDHEVDVERLTGDGKIKIEDLNNQKRLLVAEIEEKNRKLSHWTKPEVIDDLTQIQMMEDMVLESIDRLQKRKVLLGERRSQRARQPSQGRRFKWLPDGHMLHAILQNDQTLAASKPIYGHHGNAAPGFHMGMPHGHPQREYNFAGFDNSMIKMDDNLNGPQSNIQEFGPGGAYYDPALHFLHV